jgi:hypothetical protein
MGYSIANFAWKYSSWKISFNDFGYPYFRNIGELIMLLNAEVINKNTSEKLILLSIEDITEKSIV